MDVIEALLDSWDRQCKIVDAVASRIDESNRQVKPSEDGWPLEAHLAHIHGVRRYWLSQFSPKYAQDLGRTLADDWTTTIGSLDEIKGHLKQSATAVRAAVGEALSLGGAPAGGYDNPIMFLQHMIWHEGWHVGLLFLGLRRAGQEPPEEWEEENIWGMWRVE